jgi:hypothetical protein
MGKRWRLYFGVVLGLAAIPKLRSPDVDPASARVFHDSPWGSEQCIRSAAKPSQRDPVKVHRGQVMRKMQASSLADVDGGQAEARAGKVPNLLSRSIGRPVPVGDRWFLLANMSVRRVLLCSGRFPPPAGFLSAPACLSPPPPEGLFLRAAKPKCHHHHPPKYRGTPHVQ